MSYGIYDGNGARGEQTGLNVTPQFNGYYFTIGEVGYAWQLGGEQDARHAGRRGRGGRRES